MAPTIDTAGRQRASMEPQFIKRVQMQFDRRNPIAPIDARPLCHRRPCLHVADAARRGFGALGCHDGGHPNHRQRTPPALRPCAHTRSQHQVLAPRSKRAAFWQPGSLLNPRSSSSRPQNIEVTEALKSHVEAKLSVPLEKFSAILNDASDVEMHIKVEKRGVHDEDHTGRSAHIAEVTAQLKGPHKSVTVSSESEDMYATIDELEARLARSLRKAKEKQQDVKINRGAKSKVGMEDDTLVDAEDDGADAMA